MAFMSEMMERYNKIRDMILSNANFSSMKLVYGWSERKLEFFVLLTGLYKIIINIKLTYVDYVKAEIGRNCSLTSSLYSLPKIGRELDSPRRIFSPAFRRI